MSEHPHDESCTISRGTAWESAPCLCGKNPASTPKALIDQIGYSYFSFSSDIDRLCEKASPDVVREAAKLLDESGADVLNVMGDNHRDWSGMLWAFLGRQYAFRRGEEIVANGGTIYCAHHDCDMRLCPPGSHGRSEP